ncbi:MAG TPA: TerC family protein [Ferrovibrio sp.]|uniref:TerC family protein n=1 Tax=Ferrovibrio sp. TaxID=1917215 RepID=UPI002B4B7D0A|nr:TerC family protein [Ferrovibrio sp.]HLT78608.1 TerC family protein [Ferrovibrio sp.]
MDLSIFLQPAALATLAGLVALELVLAVDNLIFITIVTNRLPPERQPLARRLGLSLAVITRILLLVSAAWLITLTKPLFTVFGFELSGRDLVLLAGGLFLIWKATTEIHHRVVPHDDPDEADMAAKPRHPAFWNVISQILILDVVFSLDSVITAIGLTEHLEIMIAAVLLSVVIMIIAAEPLARFVNRNPNVVMLALSFLVMIGMTLVGESVDIHMPKAVVYGAMAFSVIVEGLNMAARRANRRSAFASIRRQRTGA